MRNLGARLAKLERIVPDLDAMTGEQIGSYLRSLSDNQLKALWIETTAGTRDLALERCTLDQLERIVDGDLTGEELDRLLEGYQ